MPKRDDLKTILILGAGPIVIGQACEFDYSGTQACAALREEGYRVVLVNSNPATIMTDPEMADATYIEPITWQVVAKIIAHEKPCALLATMGGQTALNCALDLAREGVLAEHGVEMIGAKREAIDCAEDRSLFREAMADIGLETPRAGIAHTMAQAWQVVEELGYPLIIRPSFTLGGSGGGIAYNREEFAGICERGFTASPTQELLIDESLLGWKEYELEVVRDLADNCLVVCSIENIDPMGVHTGDSITVAPAQTLTDQEYQRMRDAAIAVLRRIGVETGGANVQFGVCPETGRMVVIEMNPRVSRSSALASKATGFPIAKVAAKLAVGYTLPELSASVIGAKIPASFEPTLDYVVIKIPRFNFDKFKGASPVLTTQMKSVGEVMALGSNFQAAMQKAIRSLEIGLYGLSTPALDGMMQKDVLLTYLGQTRWDRLWLVAQAFRIGIDLEATYARTRIDRWFLQHIQALIEIEASYQVKAPKTLGEKDWRCLKSKGFADAYLAQLWGMAEDNVYELRMAHGVKAVYKRVDSCAAEFPCATQFYYSTYDVHNEVQSSQQKKVVILGSGPNRIGQGIEFDYCCVHAAMALKQMGYEAIMVNCNPETVSTDPDVSDRLYFEPLSFEDVWSILDTEQPMGVIVHFGGQTPLKLTQQLHEQGIKILGTSADAIRRAEDRQAFSDCLQVLGLQQPAQKTVVSTEVGQLSVAQYQYPVLVRPSFVLGGKGMAVLYSPQELSDYFQCAQGVSVRTPLLVDRFLDHAIEVDVDCLSDGQQCIVAGMMEHIEEAGVHSGDSACCIPVHTLSADIQQRMVVQSKQLAQSLQVVGLMNIQFAVKDDEVYILEVNPRASRTVPFLSKVLGVPLAQIATKLKIGSTLLSLGLQEDLVPAFSAVKQPVFPFNRFPEVDPVLGPEMYSTGEVMGIGGQFAVAYAQAHHAIHRPLPTSGQVLLTVCDDDKEAIVAIAKAFVKLQFTVLATIGTAKYLAQYGVHCRTVHKVADGRPHVVDAIKNGDVDLVVNTTLGRQAHLDSMNMRQAVVQADISYTTTLSGAMAMVQAIACQQDVSPQSLQTLYATKHNHKHSTLE